jgi:23S rRNA pseudouridine1911/1915/1917 synthase
MPKASIQSSEVPGDESHRLTVSEDEEGERLDKFLANQLDHSRSQLKKLIKKKYCRVNGEVITKPSHDLDEDDVVQLTVPGEKPMRPEPQDLRVPLIYEDEHIAVVSKPAGMVVHPAKGHPRDTLVNAMLGRYGVLPEVQDLRRPGIVHRIDKETSGVMVVARTDDALHALQEQFAAHSIEREYVAISVRVNKPGLNDDGDTIRTMHGRDPSNRMKFSGSEGTREAVTHYQIEERFEGGASLVRCQLETGRTHQIRMHLSELGAPLLGDGLYGGKSVEETKLIDRTALHAAVLGFEHPDTGDIMRFESPMPEDMEHARSELRAGKGWQ